MWNRIPLFLGGLALALAIAPGTALASKKCLCNNGEVVTSMSDWDDACENACDMFGGGRDWRPQDEIYDDDDTVVRPRGEGARHPEGHRPAQRRR